MSDFNRHRPDSPYPPDHFANDPEPEKLKAVQDRIRNRLRGMQPNPDQDHRMMARKAAEEDVEIPTGLTAVVMEPEIANMVEVLTPIFLRLRQQGMPPEEVGDVLQMVAEALKDEGIVD